MLRVGLTGGIACGKSEVRRMLERRGAFAVDADALVHELFRPGGPLAARIAAELGPEMLDEQGGVDRRRLGRLVFADEAARRRLNALVHPVVREEIRRRLEEAERAGARIGVVDAALLVETGSYRDYDVLVVVDCPRAKQIARLAERGLDRDEALRRIEAQAPAEEKRRRADYVIDTGGSLADTERQVDELWRRLLARAEAGGAG